MIFKVNFIESEKNNDVRNCMAFALLESAVSFLGSRGVSGPPTLTFGTDL